MTAYNGRRVNLEVSRDGWTGGLQVSINLLDADGGGTGYRLAGPKFNGSSELLLRADLDDRDVQQIRWYLTEGTRRRPGPKSGSRWPASKVKPCGTEAAYRRHLRRGENPDESCREAASRAGIARKRARQGRNP